MNINSCFLKQLTLIRRHQFLQEAYPEDQNRCNNTEATSLLDLFDQLMVQSEVLQPLKK